jgi:hypothetical protein
MIIWYITLPFMTRNWASTYNMWPWYNLSLRKENAGQTLSALVVSGTIDIKLSNYFLQIFLYSKSWTHSISLMMLADCEMANANPQIRWWQANLCPYTKSIAALRWIQSVFFFFSFFNGHLYFAVHYNLVDSMSSSQLKHPKTTVSHVRSPC